MDRNRFESGVAALSQAQRDKALANGLDYDRYNVEGENVLSYRSFVRARIELVYRLEEVRAILDTLDGLDDNDRIEGAGFAEVYKTAYPEATLDQIDQITSILFPEGSPDSLSFADLEERYRPVLDARDEKRAEADRELAAYEAIWFKADTDRDRVLTVEELEKSQGWKEFFTEKTIDMLDTNKDGKIQFEEVYKFEKVISAGFDRLI